MEFLLKTRPGVSAFLARRESYVVYVELLLYLRLGRHGSTWGIDARYDKDGVFFFAGIFIISTSYIRQL